MDLFTLIIVVLVAIAIIVSGCSWPRSACKQYERGVIFVLGTLTGAKGPGVSSFRVHFAYYKVICVL